MAAAYIFHENMNRRTSFNHSWSLTVYESLWVYVMSMCVCVLTVYFHTNGENEKRELNTHKVRKRQMERQREYTATTNPFKRVANDGWLGVACDVAIQLKGNPYLFPLNIQVHNETKKWESMNCVCIKRHGTFSVEWTPLTVGFSKPLFYDYYAWNGLIYTAHTHSAARNWDGFSHLLGKTGLAFRHLDYTINAHCLSAFNL